MFTMLIEELKDVEVYVNDSPLVIITAIYGSSKDLKYIISHGLDVNQIDNQGWIPLMYAIKYDKFKNEQVLLELGADLNYEVAEEFFKSLMMFIVWEIV